MIGIVTNMIAAACNTSGVLVTAAASDRVAVCASAAEDTSCESLYWIIFRVSDLI